MDRLINLNIDDGAVREARHKTVMNTLVQQIIKGNVIPVLGNEMVKINGVPSSRFLLEAIARKVFGITEPILSYTALLNHQKDRVSRAVFPIHHHDNFRSGHRKYHEENS